MARDRDRTQNPATAALKSQKQATIKKQKAQIAAQRTARLAHRNPDRLQKQIDELLASKEAQGGKLRPKDQQTLEGLERDVRMVRKAREGDPSFGLGGEKRKREGGEGSEGQRGGRGERARGRGGRFDGGDRRRRQYSDEPDTDPEVRDIPMPRDTPPPIPPRRQHHRNNDTQPQTTSPTSNNNECALPSQSSAFRSHTLNPSSPSSPSHSSHADLNASMNAKDNAAPPRPAKIEYSSAPVIRDLRQEAVSRFVPAAVAAKAKAAKQVKDTRDGKVVGKLLEPEELERLEGEERARRDAKSNVVVGDGKEDGEGVEVNEEEDEDVAMIRELEEQERAFKQENARPSQTSNEGQDMNMDTSIGEDIRHRASEIEKEAHYNTKADMREDELPTNTASDTYPTSAIKPTSAAQPATAAKLTSAAKPTTSLGLVDYGDSDSASDEDDEAKPEDKAGKVAATTEHNLHQVEMEEVEDEG